MILLLLIIIVIGTWNDIKGWKEFDFSIQLNTFTSPYFQMGISFNKFELRDGSIEKELIIGMFFLVISITWWFAPEEI